MKVVTPEKVLERFENEMVLYNPFLSEEHQSPTTEELILLCSIAAGRGKVLEIGTGKGLTARCLSLNCFEVYTIDLPAGNKVSLPGGFVNTTPPGDVGIYAKDSDNDNIVFLRMDSRRYDYSHGPFDMVFIDGCHALDFVKPDTENSLSHLSPGGVIVWHDYGYGLDVDKYLNSLSLPLEHIEGTRLVFYERGG